MHNNRRPDFEARFMQQSTCSICGGREGSDVLLHINNGARIDAAAGLSLLEGKERPDFTSLRKEGRYTHVCVGGVLVQTRGKGEVVYEVI